MSTTRVKINGQDVDRGTKITVNSNDDDTYPDWMGWVVVAAGIAACVYWYFSFK